MAGRGRAERGVIPLELPHAVLPPHGSRPFSAAAQARAAAEDLVSVGALLRRNEAAVSAALAQWERMSLVERPAPGPVAPSDLLAAHRATLARRRAEVTAALDLISAVAADTARCLRFGPDQPEWRGYAARLHALVAPALGRLVIRSLLALHAMVRRHNILSALSRVPS